MGIAYTITPRSITLVLDNRHRQLDDSHPSFYQVRNWLILHASNPSAEALDLLRYIVEIPRFIGLITEGGVQVSHDEVTHGSKPDDHEPKDRKVDEARIASLQKTKRVPRHRTREARQAAIAARRAGIGARIERARLEQRLSLAALAKVLGLRSHASAWNWVNGRCPVPDVLMPRLAALLGVSEIWLRYGTELP